MLCSQHADLNRSESYGVEIQGKAGSHLNECHSSEGETLFERGSNTEVEAAGRYILSMELPRELQSDLVAEKRERR